MHIETKLHLDGFCDEKEAQIILVAYGYKKVDFQIDDRQTDTEAGIRTCRAASLHLKI